MLIMGGSDVQITDCKVERLQCRIGQRLYPLQADGISVTDVKNLSVQNCQISKVWEGIDITGGLCDGILVRDCQATEILSFGFKLAHPKRNAKYIDCTTIRTGNSGFVMGPEVENLEFIRCKALETGASGYWLRDNGQHLTSIRGFSIETDKMPPNPLNVKFDHCSAINKKFPKTMDFGFLCEGDVNPEERQIRAVGCTVVGAAQKDFHGLVVQQ
jgi:hypothetical protein